MSFYCQVVAGISWLELRYKRVGLNWFGGARKTRTRQLPASAFVRDWWMWKLRLLLLEEVDVALGEWDGDVFLVEAHFDLFVELEVEVPVVLDFHPRAEGEVDGAVSHFHDTDEGCRLGEHLGFCFDDFFEHAFDLANVVSVADARHEVETSDALLGVVFYDSAGGDGVWNDLGTVVEGDDCGGKDADLLDDSFRSSGDHVVANLIRLENDDEDACGEVGQGSLKGESNCETCSTDYGNQRGGLNADAAQGSDDDEGQ